MIEGAEPLAVAAAVGFLLGFEREHHARVEGEERPAAGARTLALVALLGALAAGASALAAAMGLGAVALLTTASYWRTSQEHRGITSEVTTLVVYALGVACQRDAALAAAAAVAVALLLEQKTRVARLVRDVVTELELDDALRFFAMALIGLPLLPDHPVDPFGALNPKALWRLVVLLAAMGWVGWVATRVLGARRGLVVSGLASGFVSASAATALLARAARDGSPEALRPALAGALAASVSTCVQAVAIVAVVDLPLAALLLGPMLGAALTLAAEVAWLSRGPPGEAEALPRLQRRPLQLSASLGLAALLSATMLLATLLQARLGQAAAVITAALAGLADAHGAALAMASLAADGALPRGAALAAIGAALGANTLTKAALAFAAGGPGFGRAFVAWLAPPVAVAAIGLALLL